MEASLEDYFKVKKSQLDDDYMEGGLNSVLDYVKTVTLDKISFEFYDDFVIAVFKSGRKKVEKLMMNKESYDEDDYIDQLSALQAHILMGMGSLEAIELRHDEQCDENSRANKMLVSALKALFSLENNNNGGRGLLSRDVSHAFHLLFTAFPGMDYCSLVYAVEACISFYARENRNDEIKKLIDTRIGGYKSLRGKGTTLYRIYLLNLYHVCEKYQEGKWKQEARTKAWEAIRHKAENPIPRIAPIQAYIDLSFEPVPPEFYVALRSAFAEVLSENLEALFEMDLSDDMTKTHCEHTANFIKDMDVTLELKQKQLSEHHPDYYIDASFVDLLMADVLYLTKDFMADNITEEQIVKKLHSSLSYAIINKNELALCTVLEAVYEYIPDFGADSHTMHEMCLLLSMVSADIIPESARRALEKVIEKQNADISRKDIITLSDEDVN